MGVGKEPAAEGIGETESENPASGMPAAPDVVIVGAGPAGAATAIALRRLAPKVSIVLIDSGTDLGPPHSETLIQEGRSSLEHLMCWEEFLEMRLPPSRGALVAWGRPELGPHRFLLCSEGRGWHLDKPLLQALLLGQAKARGVTVMADTRLVDVRPHGPAGALEMEVRGLEGAAGAPTIRARFVVDATGRRASVARRLGARKVRFDRLIAAVVSFSGSQKGASRDWDALVEAHELGFWYVAPRSCGATLSGDPTDDRFVAAFVTDADLARERRLANDSSWHDLFRTSSCRELIQPDRAEGPPFLREVGTHFLDPVVDTSWMAVGDAASASDWLVGQGIEEALRAGIRAASAMADRLAGREVGLHRYQRSVERFFEDKLLTRKTLYLREQRWPRALFWRRRYERIYLDTDQLLTFDVSAAGPGRLEALDRLLTSDQWVFLGSLCTAPRLTQSVVEAFQGRYDLSEKRILMALQFLAEENLLVVE